MSNVLPHATINFSGALSIQIIRLELEWSYAVHLDWLWPHYLNRFLYLILSMKLKRRQLDELCNLLFFLPKTIKFCSWTRSFWRETEILTTALRSTCNSLAQFGHITKDVQYLASFYSDFNIFRVCKHCNSIGDVQYLAFFLLSF